MASGIMRIFLWNILGKDFPSDFMLLADLERNRDGMPDPSLRPKNEAPRKIIDHGKSRGKFDHFLRLRG